FVFFVSFQKPGMEELTIWEQHTITLNKDPKLGFGFAISGGKDKPHPDNGDTAVVVSDVLPNGPAMGRLFTKDQIVMVNGTSMDNVHSNYTIQILKACGKAANVVSAEAKYQPKHPKDLSCLMCYCSPDPPRRTRRYSDGSDNRPTNRYRARSTSPDRNGIGNTLPLMSSGYKRLPHHDVPDKPIRTTLIKKKITDGTILEYGLKLGSQIFIKHMTETGLAAKEGTLQEGDLILKINGMTTENLSLLETKHLVEKSRGKLTMTVLRDDRKFLVSIPEVDDSAPNSEDGRRHNSSSELEDISDLDPDSPPHRTSRQPTREKRTRRVSCHPHLRTLFIWMSPYISSLFTASSFTFACSVWLSDSLRYSSDVHTVSFVKEGSVGLRLVGGNDVGIFVGGVQPNSSAYNQGMKEGDQIMQVNSIDFGHFTREEAANFLLHIKKGEQVEICTQHKMDIYKKITKSNLADNFYVRTHFDHEAEGPIGLSFTRGEVFRVVDTMHRGKLGNWLAVRMGNNLHEMDKGTIPNQARSGQDEKIETDFFFSLSKNHISVSGPRAEFWKLRGLRGNKKNEKNVRRSRDDLLQLTIQGKFPAYERVLLREANFKRPIVILGPLNDIAMEKLAREMPDEYEVAEMVPRSGGGDGASTVIKLDTVRRIAEKDKHPLLDITPTAVERLNYIQYHPMVLFLDPHNRKDVKAMRQRYSPNSNKSSRRLFTQALKMRKHCSHLFSARIDLQPNSSIWYESLKDKIRHQQSKPVWVSEVTLETGGEQDLDALDQTQSDYLSAASDLEDTDGEAFTDEVYTDNEDLEEAYPARSSEPAYGHHSPTSDPEPDGDTYSLREIPPLMHVPEPRSIRQDSYSPPHSPEEEEEEEEDEAEAPHRSFTDSDFSALDGVAPNTPSEGPPDFIAPDPTIKHSVNEPSYAEEQPESPQHISLSAIEEKLQQVVKKNTAFIYVNVPFECVGPLHLEIL
uniref:Tight junction protein 3 n=1 Tax=Scophthalmus maximus TaxID=52904 RepID=A0A8D3BT85_SCOMX